MGTWSPGPGATPGNDYFLGGDGNDYADGKAGDDILNGGAGNDTMDGNTGNDTLYGADGNDSLWGGAGNDYFFDTDGNDTIYGADGNDTIHVEDRYTNYGDKDYIDAGIGDDLVQVASNEGGGTLTGGDGFDILEFFVGQSDYSVNLSQYSINSFERLNANMALYGNISDFTKFTYLRLSADDATLTSQMSITFLNSGSVNLLGRLGDQAAYIATFSSGNNYVQSGAGNDNLVGGSGNDTLDASAGDDNINGADGNDAIYGFIGNDSLYGGYGNDLSDAGSGNDLLVDIDGSDTLYGGIGDDNIFNYNFTGSAGFSDYIDGGDGNDQLYVSGLIAGEIYGGTGNDLLVINQQSGSDFSLAAVTVGGFETLLTNRTNLSGTVETFATFASIRLSGNAADLTTQIDLTLTNGGVLDLSASLGAQRAAITAGHDPVRLTTGAGDVVVTASVGNDSVTGGGGDDTFYGGAGADVLYGGGGNDHLVGDDAFDRFVFTLDSDIIHGGDGNDLMEGNGGTDYLYGGNGNDAMFGDYQNKTSVDDDLGRGDYMEGGEGNDTILGQVGDDTIYGGNGNDSISGTGHDPFTQGGNNRLYGEGGDDYIYDSEIYDFDLLKYIEATTYVDGGLGADTIECHVSHGAIFGGANPDGNALGDVLRAYTQSLAGLTIDGVETLDARGIVTASIAQLDAFDHIVDFDTTPYVDHIPTLKLFDSGSIDLSDELGTQKVKITASGATRITTGGGDDTLIGSASADTLNSGAGNDSLSGGVGNDTLKGGPGDDAVYGGTGADRMSGNAGNDTYYIDSSGDHIYEFTTAGIDDGGHDLVVSSISFTLGVFQEDLTLAGTASAGYGNDLNNLLRGNAASNKLDGGLGADTMLGGGGNDYYYVDNIGDVVSEQTTPGVDDGGTDRVTSTINYSLGTFLENLCLIGSTAVIATGNDLANIIIGNAANNRITGGAGGDILTGGAGADTFVFAHFGAANGNDHLRDFVSGTDHLSLTAADYGWLPGHVLTAAELSLTGVAVGATKQFVYNPTTHQLYWDSNGSNAGGSVALAAFDNGGTPHTGDFLFT